MATRPNILFSIIVFGTALLYTIINWLPSIRHENGLSPTLLLISLGVMSTAAIAATSLQRR